LWWQLRPDWAPLGAARFARLVAAGFYDGVAASFSVVVSFIIQRTVRSTNQPFVSDHGSSIILQEQRFKNGCSKIIVPLLNPFSVQARPSSVASEASWYAPGAAGIDHSEYHHAGEYYQSTVMFCTA
jgi:hypothetical protein